MPPASIAPDDAATPSSRAELLKSWALEEGFHRAGVARLEPSAQGEALRRWIARGDHAGMEWIERRLEARDDPRCLLDGARTALCVALHYHPLDDEPEPTGDLWPRVARYARGRDYHVVMTRRLKRLERRIVAAFPGAAARWYVDTGPILERELAARAGLGWQGKHTNLLARRLGSWFLLGELLLTLDLEPDPPAADLCGRCTRCLDACPTGALPEPYRLDSRRCISYWTIEHRGDLPPAAREMVGTWVFGCDVCQEVCPFNVRLPPFREDTLRLPEIRRELDLAGLLALGREEFVRRFPKSPMKRPKLDGLRRNAAVAMGNRGDPRYVAPLRGALADPEPVLRRHAAWALGRIGSADARRALDEALQDETDATTREEIEAALARWAPADLTGGGSGA
ncbi:MAG: tRNA epoxyqueuosine(34) reductase QueG [Acidobacteriota bacterium]